MKDKSKLCCNMIVIVIILTGCYGRDSNITLYETLAEIKENI